MNRVETANLIGEVTRMFPAQDLTTTDVDNWQTVLSDFRYAECLVAVALLRQWQPDVDPGQIKRQVLRQRSVSARPNYQPGGSAWAENRIAHGVREYRGGPVCFDPKTSCDGICRDCPLEREAAS